MNRILNFKTTPGRICLTSCINNLFNHLGLEVNESIIFTLAEASQFYYKRFDLSEEKIHYKEIDLAMGGMRYDISLMIDNIIQHFPIKIDKEANFERVKSRAFIEDHIEDQFPIIALVSREYLDYMNPVFQNTISHFINIIGYDWSVDQLYISDSYIPTNPITTYEGPLAFDKYYNGILSSFDKFEYELEFRELAFIPQELFTDSQLSIEALMEALKNTAEGFFSEICSAQGESTGLKGLEMFLEDFTEWITLDNIEIQSGLFRDIHQRLSNFGGPVVTNKLFADFSSYLVGRKLEPHFVELYQYFSELSKSWSIIANLFGKYSFSRSNKIKENLHQRIDNIIQMETSVYNKIREM